MNGQSIVEILNKNISLTYFGYENNEVDTEFTMNVSKEIELNTNIVKTIIPQLINQEIGARDIAFKEKQLKKIEIKTKNTKKSKESSNALAPTLLRSITGRKMF